MRSAVKIVRCDSSLTTTSIGGAPNKPSRSTSQPTRANSSWRAVRSAVTFAICAPVTNPTLQGSGSPNSSFSHTDTICSITAAIGDMANT